MHANIKTYIYNSDSVLQRSVGVNLLIHANSVDIVVMMTSVTQPVVNCFELGTSI